MRKKQISIVLLLVMALVMASPMIRYVQASPTTIIEILPETTVVGIEENFTVSVNILDAIDLYGLQFVLRYNPNVLNAVAVDVVEEFATIDRELTGDPVWDGYNCDVVEDGVLDIYDYFAFADAYGTEGDLRYNPRADFDDDGDVDKYDYNIFATAWDTVDMPGTIQFFRLDAYVVWEGGILANVTFKAISSGETVLDLGNVKLSTDMGEPIPYEIRNGTVEIIESPAEATQDLIDQVQAFNLQQGIENSLDKKLQAVQDALTALNVEQRNDEINKLNAFINEIEAQRDNKITTEQADLLIASTQAIIAVLM